MWLIKKNNSFLMFLLTLGMHILKHDVEIDPTRAVIHKQCV